MLYNIRYCDYVPEPEPVSTDYTIACHYFPGWKVGTHVGFSAIENFPERTPLIGYYNESDPRVADWEVKWALEHGINCWVYCWYRRKENVGHPVTPDGVRLEHCLREGLFKSRYGHMMNFAIMWEAHNCGGAADVDDLCNNLLPFWHQEYFSKPNYLRIDGKPVMFVYDYAFKVMDGFGGPEGTRAALEACSEKAKEYGYPGIHWAVEYRYDDPKILDKFKTAGYSETFAYCWHTPQQFPTQEEVLENQLHLMTSRVAYDPTYTMLTCSQSWDPYPWAKNDEARAKCTRWKLTPANWRILLERVKGLADSLPGDSLTSKFILLDNWNEWSEGHYLSPHMDGGFKYLQAVREVFTKRDNLPDYRLPDTLGLEVDLWK